MSVVFDEKFRTLVDYIQNGIPAIKRTGIRVLEIRDYYVKLIMPLEGNTNHIGMMYAGSLFCIGEISGGVIHGVAFDVNKYVPIVKEVNIKFTRPALTDVTMEVSMDKERAEAIQATAAEKGKADFTMELELKDSGGQVVSRVNGVWQIRPLPPGMKSPMAGE